MQESGAGPVLVSGQLSSAVAPAGSHPPGKVSLSSAVMEEDADADLHLHQRCSA